MWPSCSRGGREAAPEHERPVGVEREELARALPQVDGTHPPAAHPAGTAGHEGVEGGERRDLDDATDGGGHAQTPSERPTISFMISVVPP